MAAGTQAYIVDKDYDPRTTTLNEFLSMFEKESVEVGGREGNKTWGNLIRNNKITKQYLDQPVITLFGAVPSESQSIMADIQNAAGGQAANIQSKFRVIEANIFPKLSTLGKKEGVDLVSGYSKISEEVKKIQTRGGKFTAQKGFNVNKIGELIQNLQEHVKKFPEDKPIANAILFNIENGSRPSLTTELRTIHYIKNQLGETGAEMGLTGRDGLLIPAGTKGVKRQAKGQAPNVQPYNAPLSKRGITILQDQSDYNSKIIGDNKKLDFFFQVLDEKGKPRPITLPDINRVLKTTTPEGMLFEYTEKGTQPLKTAITSKNLRNLFINSAALVVDKENIAMLTNRDTAINTGSQEIYMGSPGQYKPKAIQDLDKISMTNWGFYTLRDTKNKQVYRESGQMLNPNQFIFGKNEIDPETKKYLPDNVEYTKFMEADAKEVPIQTKGFSPPDVDKTTTKELAEEKPITSISSEHFDDDELKALEDIGISEDKPTTTKDKIVKVGKALKGPAKLAVAPTLFGLMLPDEVTAAEERFEGTDTGFIREGIKDLGLQDTAAQVEGAVVAGAKAFDPGVELAYDVTKGVGEYVKEAREKGIPEALGLDTEKQQRMNVLRKQRLADRVERNRSYIPPEDQGFINQNQIGR